MTDTYYGQEGQDSIISQFFHAKGIKNGKFLDVGSLDGIRFSNTLRLEQAGWSGICVEMHPSYYDLLVENRPNSICYSCGASDEDKVRRTVSLNWRASMSTTDFSLEEEFGRDKRYYGDREEKEINGFLNGHHEVELRTLDSILEENKDKFSSLDFVSIDIDGSERKALPHCDLSECPPHLLSLEYSVVGDHFVREYAAKYGLYPSRRIGADILFVRNQDDSNLLNSLFVQGEMYHNNHPATGGD